jgi:hypothetical protein
MDTEKVTDDVGLHVEINLKNSSGSTQTML